MLQLPKSGDLIDGFILGSCLHEGGMGWVFRLVPRPEDPFPQLMKVPRIGRNQPTEGIVGFEVESMILGALDSPHVPRFVAAGDLAETPYLVMEEIAGENLEELARRAPLPASEVARIGAAIADALASLHRQDALHLDIKPGNVILRPDGVAVLIDFGLARHARLPDLLAEEMRRAVGTPAYISPEQVIGVREDPRSDLFGLGVTLYELATGELPFGAPASVSSLRDRLWLEPRPPRAIARDFPEWLQEVILKCMEPLPQNRYASAAQLGFDLRHPDQVTVTERGRKRRRRGFWAHVRRWMGAAGREAQLVPTPSEQVGEAPIVLAAVDTRHLEDDLQRQLQATVRRIIAHSPSARLSCVSVLRDAPTQEGPRPEESASGLVHRDLVRLRHWCAPLDLPPERLSLHVLEGSDTARLILEYARTNHASLIVMGAAHYSEPRLGLGRSITTEVVEDAPCSVYVVRGANPVLDTSKFMTEKSANASAAPGRTAQPAQA